MLYVLDIGTGRVGRQFVDDMDDLSLGRPLSKLRHPDPDVGLSDCAAWLLGAPTEAMLLDVELDQGVPPRMAPSFRCGIDFAFADAAYGALPVSRSKQSAEGAATEEDAQSVSLPSISRIFRKRTNAGSWNPWYCAVGCALASRPGVTKLPKPAASG